MNLINTVATYNISVPSLDVWGANIYRGNTFGSLFNDYKKLSQKPLGILEYGIDAYDNIHGSEYEHIGTPYQANYAEALWKEIEFNSDVCIGGCIMAYSDEWWKGKYSTDPGCPDNNPVYHSVCSYAAASHPDGYCNEEWWGIMRTVDNGSNPDIMQARAAYYKLQSIWSVSQNMGDINNDGNLDISDVILDLRCALGLPITPYQCLPCGDINGGGIVDISDVILTVRTALGLDSPKPCTD